MCSKLHSSDQLHHSKNKLKIILLEAIKPIKATTLEKNDLIIIGNIRVLQSKNEGILCSCKVLGAS